MNKTLGLLLIICVCCAWAAEAEVSANKSDSLEFVYPLLFGFGGRYEHRLSSHFAFVARPAVGFQPYLFSYSGDAGVVYYFNGHFNGFYSQLGAGYLAAYFPQGGSNDQDTKAGPDLTLDLGWKSLGSGWYVRADIGAKFEINTIVPTMELGIGGNL